MLGLVFTGALAAGAHCSADDADVLGNRHSTIQEGTADGGVVIDAAHAQAMFAALQSDLATSCGGVCHEGGMNGAPAWMKGPDAYATIKAYPGIVVPIAASSSLVTKGKHEGPPLPDALATRVAAWLGVEAALLSATPEIATADIALPSGTGSVALPSNLGTITFDASLTGGILDLGKLTVVASAASGVHLAGVHLTFTHADGSVTVDPSLAFADVTAPKAQSVPLDVGIALVPRVVASDKVRFVFDKLEASSAAADAGTTTGGGGCKDVDTFANTAAPAIQTATCLNCHDSGGSGNGALDLSGLNATPPDFDGACAQTKNKIDTADPANSPLILAPTGGEAAHPFQGARAPFVNAMTPWITAEK